MCTKIWERIPELHKEAESKAFKERLLGERQSTFLQRCHGIVLAFKYDLGHHLGILSVGVAVRGIFLVGMESLCDLPCFLRSILADEPRRQLIKEGSILSGRMYSPSGRLRQEE